MFRMYKSLMVFGVATSLSIGVWGSPNESVHDLAWYANAVQAVIDFAEYDEQQVGMRSLFSAESPPASESLFKVSFSLNGAETNMEQLEEELKNTDAIVFRVSDWGKTDGFAAQIVKILKLIGELDINDHLINCNLEYFSESNPAECDIVKILSDGSLMLGNTPVELSDLHERLSADCDVGIETDPRQPQPPFSRILQVVNGVGTRNIHHLFIADRQQIEISAEIYHLNADGTRDILAAPRVSTMPGYFATIRVVENASGRKPYKPEQDAFHQEDLANLGIRFSVKPQIIGDYVRVSGVAILTKASDLKEAFQEVDIPVHSYTVTKTVAPFSVVLPSDNEIVEFPVAEVGGKKTICRLNAVIIDAKGMSQADRDLARSAAQKQPTQIDLFESRSK